MSNLTTISNSDFIITNLQEKGIVSSITVNTPEEKKALHKALTNPTHPLQNFINKQINVKDILMQSFEIEDEETGELVESVKIVLFDDKNVSYVTISKGVLNALQNLIFVYGSPDTWGEPIKIEIKQVQFKDKKVMTFEVV